MSLVGEASSCALFVGTKPLAVRTNKTSSKTERAAARARLTAEFVTPSSAAAKLALLCLYTAKKILSCWTVSWSTDIGLIH